MRHFRLQYSYTTLLCISLFFLKNAEKKVLKSIDNFLTGVWLRFFAHFLRILGADMYASSRMFMRFWEKEWGARTVRQGLTRMQGYIACVRGVGTVQSTVPEGVQIPDVVQE